MGERKGAVFGRIALLLLTVYALALIAPDVLRVVVLWAVRPRDGR